LWNVPWRVRTLDGNLHAMGRHPRLQVAGMYHVTTHAVANSWLFLEDEDYTTRLSLLAQAVADGWMRCHAFCLMGNHEHLLISVDENRLAALMQRLNRSYAGTFNSAHHRRGRVYRAPYNAEPVISERHLIELIRYLALNPEHADFGRAESYRFSSYPALVGIVQPLSFVDPTPLYDVVGGGQNAQRTIVNLVADGRLRKRAA
jgi:putative transposase